MRTRRLGVNRNQEQIAGEWEGNVEIPSTTHNSKSAALSAEFCTRRKRDGSSTFKSSHNLQACLQASELNTCE